MLLSNAAISRRSTVFTLMVIALVAGLYSYLVLPRESAPDITIPVVLVVTNHEGVAPEDIETLITLPLERKLKGLKDVEKMRSVSSEGSSMITIEFTPDIDIDNARQLVRDRVDQAKGDLPDDLENDPSILEINIAEFPILMIAVSGPVGEVVLKQVAERLEDYIEQIPGVLDVAITGERARQVRVEFDPDRLAAYRLSFVEIMAAIQRENVNIPGGSIDIGEGKYLLRIPGEFTDPAQIDNLVLVVRDGRPIYFKDVANIVDTFEDPLSYARLNGEPSVTLAIKKRTGENIIAVADQVFAVLEQAQDQLPPGVELAVTLNQSKDIRRMVAELENSILTGLILVVLVLFLFLGLRNSLFVALAIPFSMLISFAVLHALGITLNMVVLFSLILALGMLVDNAIVIVENIYRHMQEGKDRVQAARAAVSEVGWPVITSTLTTLCAFSPLMFWPGIMGEFMKFLPLTLIVTLSASLFVALVINPVVCASFLWVGRRRPRSEALPPVLRLYQSLLQWALRRRALVMVAAGGFLVGIAMLYAFFEHGVELFPDIEPNLAYVEISAPEGTNLDTSDVLARAVEEIAFAEADLRFVISEVGVSANAEMGGEGGGQSHQSKISLDFVEREERREHADAILARIRQAVAALPGAEIKVEKHREGPPTGPPVSIEVSGEDIDILARVANEIKERIKDVRGLVDLKDDLVRANPEIRILVDREKASLLGLSTVDISETVKAAVSGTKLGVYREGNEEYDIVARLPEQRRRALTDVTGLLIPSMTGDPVPISSLATFEMGTGFGSIRRINQKRVVTITANTAGRNSIEVLREVQGLVADLEVPAGYRIDYSGEQEEQEKAVAFLSKAFIAAILLITLVLVTQFNSFRQALIVMTSVILSLSGVFLGLTLTGMAFGIIMTGIGVISLAGVVVNNAIVLIDYINQLRRSGLGLEEALVRAGVVRFRPVLLTAATTILGLLPMALGFSFDFRSLSFQIGGESAEWWGPMAVAVIFGLAVATLLTLVVVPVLYSLLHDKPPRGWFGSLRRRGANNAH
ncbi:efflux RND transporter permease subunit [Geoalkalibacter halelectricus]|uniref:Efflux RND transporter permease subunit n=1 Tax=Geoalkalibacter halelectricus TaxID=2847045 RepID=A0ABY5ZMR0_9BACT|nr:efflux RND transporter permease subunit [Geoalkalibacter halelectricus]MDO3380062.1 efflux RND transporter permease subunit [Geoalkalibacter halelectricus]UWZ80416.1 efflux RND transporter permease subunit [Geoalkalibacter halelectricus]